MPNSTGSGPIVNFIGIGAQKCASTWLHDNLVGHPAVAMPAETKELDYFSCRYDFGRQWYESHFDAAPGVVARGEVSPSYLHNPGVVTRVADYNPHMRILLIVRDPIDRAISNHKHEVRIGHLRGPDLSFEFGLQNNPAYVEQGMYARHLRRWLSRFPSRQVLVLGFDDVVADPEQVYASACRFLRIDGAVTPPSLFGKSNESYLNRHGWLEKGKNGLRSLLRSAGLGRAWERLGDAGLRDRYRQYNRQAPEQFIPAPLPDTLSSLKETFSPDVEDLRALTGLPTDSWLQQS